MSAKKRRPRRFFGRAYQTAGELLRLGKRKLTDLSERDGDCLIWRGNIDYGGYGRLRIGRQLYQVHRLAKALHDGKPYERKLHVHHVCRRRACINPEHLELLTSSEHSKRHHAENDTGLCKRGHSMADAYRRPDTGTRMCRVCIADRKRKAWEKWRRDLYRPPDARPCVICGKSFYPLKRREARYCGQGCRMARFLAARKAANSKQEVKP